jgi:hypothetical protein
MFETGPNFSKACMLLAYIWVPAALLYAAHDLWPADLIRMDLHPGWGLHSCCIHCTHSLQGAWGFNP